MSSVLLLEHGAKMNFQLSLLRKHKQPVSISVSRTMQRVVCVVMGHMWASEQGV